jgi:hypothetical protein
VRVVIATGNLAQGDRIQTEVEDDSGEEQHRQDGPIFAEAVRTDASRQNTEGDDADQRSSHSARERAAKVTQ